MRCSSRAYRCASAILTMILLGAVPAAATATVPASPFPPGVHVDPGSPAAQEYAIPLGQARAGGSAGGSTTIFGSGITQAPTSNVGGAESEPAALTVGANQTRSGHRHRTRAAASSRAAGQAPKASSTAAPGAESVLAAKVLGPDHGDGGALAWMAGAAALVVALGASLGGLLAHRNRRRSPGTA
jgi:hypothetical protein